MNRARPRAATAVAIALAAAAGTVSVASAGGTGVLRVGLRADPPRGRTADVTGDSPAVGRTTWTGGRERSSCLRLILRPGAPQPGSYLDDCRTHHSFGGEVRRGTHTIGAADTAWWSFAGSAPLPCRRPFLHPVCPAPGGAPPPRVPKAGPCRPYAVTARLSTVTGADRIVVIDAGRVRAVDAHAELVAQDLLYAQPPATQLLATA